MHACYLEIWKQNMAETIIKFERLCLLGGKQEEKKEGSRGLICSFYFNPFSAICFLYYRRALMY